MVRSKLKKTIISIVLMIVLLGISIFSFTYAWFTDIREENIEMNIASVSFDASGQNITAELTPSDLIANNEFEKILNLNITTDFSIYFRTYAIVTVETVDPNSSINNVKIIERTDLVTLAGEDAVTSCIKKEDGKYYYAVNDIPQAVESTTIELTFSFKVSSEVSEDLYTLKTGEEVRGLKTTVKFFVEYCQEEGYENWT